MADTLLRLDALPWPPFSARAARQALEPLGLGALKRSVNGELAYVGTGAEKFRSTIRGRDAEAPDFDGVFRGMETSVDCIAELTARISVGGSGAVLARDPVPGSVRALDASGAEVEISGIEGREVSLAGPAAGDVFVVYRPRLAMLVEGWACERDEWGAVVSWEITLVEV
jgi:hypothetical protein